MSDGLDEIIVDFLMEAEESLDTIDPLFIELEVKGDDKELLNQIFRSVHTIKGAAGFLGLQQVVDVAHGAENILKKLRDGEIALTRPMMDAILKSIDMLRLLLKHIKLKDGSREEIGPLLQELEAVLVHREPQATPELPTIPPPTSPGEPPGDALNKDVPPPAFSFPKEDPAPASETGAMPGVPGKTPPQAMPAEALHTLRVDTDKIDKVMNLTGEVVLIRNRLLNLLGYLSSAYPDDAHIDGLEEAVSFLDLVTSDLQLSVMKIRMQPINKVFGKFPRLVRDMAATMNKDVELKISGEDTEVDKTVIENIGDPLVHIIRNAVDHGIESKEERKALGKPEKGTISINAYQKGNKIVIAVSDDGRGINVEKVKRKAVDKNLITEEDALKMTDEAATNLIFLPGFSTHDIATELSGRGVGMDVVKTNIAKLNGYCEVVSTQGARSSFVITIPLTLAIIETLMVRAGRSIYAVPLGSVQEITRFSPQDMHEIIGNRIVRIRDVVYPIYSLAAILGERARVETEACYAVIVSFGSRPFCLAVDKLVGREEVVIKNVAGLDANASTILGATITGDGKVVLVLDLGNIYRRIFNQATL